MNYLFATLPFSLGPVCEQYCLPLFFVNERREKIQVKVTEFESTFSFSVSVHFFSFTVHILQEKNPHQSIPISLHEQLTKHALAIVHQHRSYRQPLCGTIRFSIQERRTEQRQSRWNISSGVRRQRCSSVGLSERSRWFSARRPWQHTHGKLRQT